MVCAAVLVVVMRCGWVWVGAGGGTPRVGKAGPCSWALPKARSKTGGRGC